MHHALTYHLRPKLVRAAGVLTLSAVSALACTAFSTYTAKDPKAKVHARPAGCSFEIVGVAKRPYTELGVIDIDVFNGSAIPEDEADFREVVARDVCAAGGDAVVPYVTGSGHYRGARVVRYEAKRPKAAKKQVKLAPEPAPPVKDAPADAGAPLPGDAAADPGRDGAPATATSG